MESSNRRSNMTFSRPSYLTGVIHFRRLEKIALGNQYRVIKIYFSNPGAIRVRAIKVNAHCMSSSAGQSDVSTE